MTSNLGFLRDKLTDNEVSVLILLELESMHTTIKNAFSKISSSKKEIKSLQKKVKKLKKQVNSQNRSYQDCEEGSCTSSPRAKKCKMDNNHQDSTQENLKRLIEAAFGSTPSSRNDPNPFDVMPDASELLRPATTCNSAYQAGSSWLRPGLNGSSPRKSTRSRRRKKRQNKSGGKIQSNSSHHDTQNLNFKKKNKQSFYHKPVADLQINSKVETITKEGAKKYYRKQKKQLLREERVKLQGRDGMPRTGHLDLTVGQDKPHHNKKISGIARKTEGCVKKYPNIPDIVAFETLEQLEQKPSREVLDQLNNSAAVGGVVFY